LENHKAPVKEEMKNFLQVGLHTYAPALVALSEFRRQVRSRLQTVLDEFSMQFSGLGLSVADLKLVGTKLDAPDLGRESPWIGLRKSQGAELITGYFVQWELGEPKDKQLWVGVDIYLGIRADRNRLFAALQKRHSPLGKSELEQSSEGSSLLSAYCDPDLFFSFDEPFRTLIEEWVGLLSGVGGIQPFLSAAAIPLVQQNNEEN
jgi:hypothetical protein